MFKDCIDFIKSLYNTENSIPLHNPYFEGNEKSYINDCINYKSVSSNGSFVNKFEEVFADFTNSKHAIATSSGTSALHTALILIGVEKNDEVITQPLTFVATANAISFTGAKPIFIDVDRDTLGLSPKKLEHFLSNETQLINGKCINNRTKRQIKAVVPMHTFGLPTKIEEIVEICNKYKILVIEDAAEALGSYYKNKHTGTFGLLGTFSFNGNKIITTGGGGMIITDDNTLAKRARQITTTAKLSHPWEYNHEEVAYNYRMPNINAALGCAQMEQLPNILDYKRKLAKKYANFFEGNSIKFIEEPKHSKSNFWLNAIQFEDLERRNQFLEFSNKNKVLCRPIWRLMNHQNMFKNSQTGNIDNSLWLENRIVNIPSGMV